MRMEQINPVAKLGVALLLSITLLLSVDIVSAAVALTLELVLIAWSGIPASVFWSRTLPLWLAAPLAGITTTLYGAPSGATIMQFGAIHVTEGSVQLGVAVMLRVLAIGLPGIVLLATTDPTDLADGLSQIVRLPHRFVLGALAGLRLVGLGMDEWRMLSLARRARGVGGGGFIGRLRQFPAQAVALLVITVRRGGALATAMEARGFGSEVKRSWARKSSFGSREWLFLTVGAMIAAIAVTAAVTTGSWNFVLA